MTTDQHPNRRRRACRTGTAVAAVIAVGLLLTGCLSTDQSQDIDLVNASRKSARLGALNADYGASDKAQAWSEHMARTGVLEHTGGGSSVDPSGLTKWCSVGENVGYGSSVAQVHDAFMASPPHKAHILGSYDRIGTGVYKSGSRYWVTEIFIRSC